MTSQKETTIEQSKTADNVQPVLTLMSGNTTFLIGLYFNDTSKETLEDKVKKLIKKDVENDDF